MPRKARIKSPSGYYHVILRGINRQVIFLDDNDRKRFIETMIRYIKETQTDVIVYCLMDNHVHLLICSSQMSGLENFVKKLASSYVFYFNQKYDRVGHLFQDRFKSEVIDSNRYLLTVARYILQNPQKALICNLEDYKWSSWNEIVTSQGFCNIDILVSMTGGRECLKEFLLADNNDHCLECEKRSSPVTDTELLQHMRTICGLDDPMIVCELPKKQRNSFVSQMAEINASVRQISRLTGLSRTTVHRILKNEPEDP